jgi:hypothetical protein
MTGSVRFARILYVDLSGNQPQVHVQWLLHGSQIPVLCELNERYELFLGDCENVDVTHILYKVGNVHFLTPEVEPPKIDPKSRELLYFCRWVLLLRPGGRC